jgi:PGF-CTERM protein
MDGPTLTRRDTLQGIGVATLGLAGVGAARAQESEITVRLDPAESTLAPGETTTVDIVVEGATSGINAYENVLVELGSSVATITDYERTRGGIDQSEIRNDGQTLALSAALLNDTHPPAAEIVIARATIEATSTGQATVAVDGGEIIGREQTEYQENGISGNVVVESGTGDGGDDQNGTNGNGGENGTGNGNDSGTDGGNGNDSDDGNDSGDGSGPGFGVGGALAGLGGLGYLLQRRLGANTGDERSR